MIIDVGSVWRHVEGKEAEIDAVTDDHVEPRHCGRWTRADFEAQWTLSSSAAEQAAKRAASAAPVEAARYAAGYKAGKKELGEEVARIIREEGILPLTYARAVQLEARILALCT